MLALFRCVSLALLLCSLASCGYRSQALRSAVDVFAGSDSSPVTTSLNPSIRYLRVSINGRVLLLALGYIDADKFGPIEVWYSANGEVLRLQNGHVVGLTGTDSEWRQVRFSALPAWPTSIAAAGPVTYTRTRDLMPGYHFGMVDKLTLLPTPAPVKSSLVALNPANLHWFVEVVEGAKFLDAHFAVANTKKGNVAVYGEQCISAELCLTWQRWPVKSRL